MVVLLVFLVYLCHVFFYSSICNVTIWYITKPLNLGRFRFRRKTFRVSVYDFIKNGSVILGLIKGKMLGH